MEKVSHELKSPVKFYSLQRRYIENINEAIKTNKVLLIEAGTGFGKTLANLYASLNSDSKKQIVYLSKTHQQNQQVILELERINEINFDKLATGLQLASRKQLCHIEHVAESHMSAAISMCTQYQKLQNKNPKYSNCISCVDTKRKLPLPIILTINKLRDLASTSHGCAYLTARDLISDFDVVTGHYNYYLNMAIREAIGADESKPILVLDEGHNLEDVLTTQYSSTLSHYTFNNAIKETKRVDYQLFNLIEFYANGFDLLVKRHGKNNEPVIFEGKEMVSIFDSFGFIASRKEKLINRFTKVHDAVAEYQKQQTGSYPTQLAISELIEFLEITESPLNFGFIIFKLPNGFRIRKECLNPALAFNKVKKSAYSIIICSGTLSPLPLWQKILRIHNEKESMVFKYGSLTDPRRVRIIAFDKDMFGNKLTTKYSHRVAQPEVYSHYLNAIKEIVNSHFEGGILVFGPSYNFIEKINFPSYIGDIKCFQEDQDAKVNSQLVENYKKTILQGNRALFSGVLGGKMSEGTDLPHDLVRIVIVIGIPYPPPNDPIIQLKRSYYETIRKGLGTEWYNAQAFRKLAQAIGRGWRTSTDYSVGILLDERLTYSSSIEQLPLWVKNSLHVAKSWQDGIQAIKKFEDVINKLKEN